MSNLVRFSFPNNTPPPLTDAQLNKLRKAAERPINYDDIPPLTEEQLSRMRRANTGCIKERKAV